MTTMLRGLARLLAVAAMLVATTCALPADAAVIVSPTSAVINTSGPGNGSINDTFNQNGLSANFTSGVTDFDAYLALGPTHTNTFSGFEWFGNQGTTTASVTYDLGSVLLIDRLALWNEESSGIGLLNLFGSLDGTTFFSLASGLTPTDNALVPYLADVFGFSQTLARFVRFDMSNCPQPIVGSFQSCAIGEVAFSVDAAAQVPEPATLGFLTVGVIAAAGLARRRRTA